MTEVIRVVEDNVEATEAWNGSVISSASTWAITACAPGR